MDAGRALHLAEGELVREELEPGERAVYDLVQKALIAPARLEPGDLAEVTACYGHTGALEILSMLASFHFINRIADMVGIQSDLPLVQPRWSSLRHLGVRLQGWVMGRLLDLSNREIEVDVDAALDETQEVLGPLPPGYRDLRKAPNVAAFLTTIAAVVRQIDPELLTRVTPVVAEALPSGEAEAFGFHARPADPIDALAFVATRYAVRTTDSMIGAIREKYGLGDPELTDLFYAISMRNAFERMDRLLAAPLESGSSS
jgi:hypothetical protein